MVSPSADDKEHMERRSLTLPSEIEHIPEARRFIEEVARELGCLDQDIADLKIAAGEACANAVEHGSPRGREGKISISVEPDGDMIRVEVRDEGLFRNTRGSLEAQMHKGRGFFLILALVDRMAVERSPDGTTVKLWKSCKGKSPFPRRGRLPRRM